MLIRTGIGVGVGVGVVTKSQSLMRRGKEGKGKPSWKRGKKRETHSPTVCVVLCLRIFCGSVRVPRCSIARTGEPCSSMSVALRVTRSLMCRCVRVCGFGFGFDLI